ncbi:hypothetical protein M438DRAFT_345454 [Aureobasidium pullulans EXF-150]|uniref:Uncharacterized protein n=1 Tax=Aureobasidium pullulans EXF-150 TaxID=1043002 RepID=A0A074XFW8_AURPU|nr:uncharacterized protein M438DRAFT_345454 [Aureobasidium pullulans EXF-150]KEQ84298.1 hypothetical protein M438DRAFT_345454 [Aureobasidium pullulans EXF-150]
MRLGRSPTDRLVECFGELPSMSNSLSHDRIFYYPEALQQCCRWLVNDNSIIMVGKF